MPADRYLTLDAHDLPREPAMLPSLLVASLLVPPLVPEDRGTAAEAGARKSLPLLAKAAAGHIEQRTCFACHNQALPMMAFDAAQRRGIPLPEETVASQTEHLLKFLAENREKYRKGEGTGGQVDTASYALLTLELAGHKADENTEAVVEYLLKRDADRDHWRTTSNRPPTEASDFTPTYLALRGLRVWGTKEQKERGAHRIEAVRGWLLKTRARDTEDRVFRLFGLKEVAADEKEVAAAAWDLLRTQRASGGWSQLDSMEPDAYATATALVALHQAGGLAPTHPAYVRGVEFLLKTQLADGSWYVKSRSKPFQKYYESGFPHGNDQFISSAATGWAATALLLTAPAKP
jgi:hypothetical protein